MSSYIDSTLLKDEQVLYRTKPHIMVFYATFIWVIAILFLCNFTFSPLFIKMVLLITAFTFTRDLVKYYFTEYVITNKRVLTKAGFIRRQVFEVFLNKIEGIYIDQGIFGRMLNFGTLIIIGIGGTKNFFYFIKQPLRFRENVQKQISSI